MASRAVKLLILQAHKLLGLALERWSAGADDELVVDGVIDDDVAQLERDRDELRRRGVDL